MESILYSTSDATLDPSPSRLEQHGATSEYRGGLHVIRLDGVTPGVQCLCDEACPVAARCQWHTWSCKAGNVRVRTSLLVAVLSALAARCTSLSKPLPGCRAPACELCLPHHGSGSSENGLLRGTYSCTLCVGPLMCASSGSLYSARASGCLFLVVCLPLHSVELSLHSVDGCRALAREA